ncbi:hypothetical protein Pst134EA_017763 [Puccinia striiformis f. sp. tritici]|uniref:hypothetical protein n=1 Tax=Puccinia striiformis f. sp. tritici TaxID=168172 RepID=UPI00200878C2|nr:hypothetical protein Pst134EA_017763 [Puccinia striiformis f. sp. tritici]KAH9461459.1 hypothetical protein Pst134EA_017763 [Puccinia striiformis f. sp. tritici]
MATIKSNETITDRLSDLSLLDQPPEILCPQRIVNEFKQVNICAPMVRYSKLPFRQLVSEYETHITFTPMILAQEFCLSSKARDSDFTTNETERGTFIMEESRSTPATHPSKRKIRGSLIAQFGGNNPLYMGHAAALLKNYVDGIDINCGCPQQWAYKEGIGSALLRKPDLVRELVRSIKGTCGEDFPVSIKIRIDDDLRNTSRLIKTAIQANVSMITVHGRARRQASSHPVNLEGIKFAREEALSSHSNGNGEIPVVANGDIFSLEDANKTREFCGVNGVMSARGLQENPALFSGYDRIPLAGIERFLDLSAQNGFMFPLFHRHLADMLGPWFTSREEKKYFNMLSSPPSVIDFLEETYNIHPSPLPEIIF